MTSHKLGNRYAATSGKGKSKGRSEPQNGPMKLVYRLKRIDFLVRDHGDG